MIIAPLYLKAANAFVKHVRITGKLIDFSRGKSRDSTFTQLFAGNEEQYSPINRQ